MIAVALLAGLRPAAAQDIAVDLELVLAVDISQSVDAYESYLQRQGYIEALADPQVIEAIQSGLHRRIAVTYIEWAGPGIWVPVAAWGSIGTADDARVLAATLARQFLNRGQGTSISALLPVAVSLFEGNGFDGERRVIDISGDGPNSTGGNVAAARDAAIAEGVTVNGVAINNFDGGWYSLPDLDVYYRECVVGGPGAFVVAADGFETFSQAILRKLILEIAGTSPLPSAEPRVHLAQAGPFGAPGPLFPAPKYAPACDVGERNRLQDNPNALP